MLLISHRLMVNYFERGADVVEYKAEVKKKMLLEKQAINIYDNLVSELHVSNITYFKSYAF